MAADAAWLVSLLSVLFISLLLHPAKGHAQNDTTDIYDLTFSELARLRITSASKVPQRVSEVPATVFVVTSQEIRERGYLSLEDILAGLPGFQFRNIQSINSYVFQRGIPNQNNLMLLLIDGVQVNELNSGGFYAGTHFNLLNIERIEVIHGPSSVAYGTNAVSGIVNIITRAPTNGEPELEAGTMAGSFHTLRSNFRVSYAAREKPVAFSLSGMVMTTNRSDMRGEANDNNWTDLMDNFDRGYAFDLNIRRNRFSWGTNYLHRQSSAAAFEKAVGTAYRDYGSLWNIRFVNNHLRFQDQLSDRVSFSSLLYNRNATVLDNTVLYVTDTAQVGYYRPNFLIGSESIVDVSFNRFLSLVGGLVLEVEQLAESQSLSYSDSPERKPPRPQNPEMVANNLVSLFVEPRFMPFENLFVSGGIRFDNSSIYAQKLTPRAGVSYMLNDHLIRLSYAEAFRAPKPWDYYDGLGNPDLLPETMESLEAAVGLIITDRIKTDLSAYRNRLGNAITRIDSDEGYRWMNRGAIHTAGTEFILRYMIPGFSSYLNYTYNDSRDEAGDAIPEISKHMANAGMTLRAGSLFVASLRASYAGERQNPKQVEATGRDKIEPYLVLHGSLTFAIQSNFRMQLAVHNMLNAEYYHSSNRVPDRYRQPQRMLLFSLSYKLEGGAI